MSVSMTGFGHGQAVGNFFDLSVEIKSVNHRFRDMRFRIPSQLSSLEWGVRKKIEATFNRGSFEVSASIKKGTAEEKQLEIDFSKVRELIDACHSEIPDHSINLSAIDLFHNEFRLDQAETKQTEIEQLFDKALTAALDGLKSTRLQEGEKLDKHMHNHLNTYDSHYQSIVGEMPKVQKALKERLSTKVQELSAEQTVDDQRLNQEVVYYLEKMDVAEEINRIQGHLKKMKDLLESSDVKGRKLEFYIQELGRETNTIGSKSQSEKVTEHVVEMKVQLEKMREQALNLE